MALSSWLHSELFLPQAKIRLFCFPYGGGVYTYQNWAKEFKNIECFSLFLPGRGKRINESLIANMEEMAWAIAKNIAPYLDRPFSFFGHSVGALIAFEVVRKLRCLGYPLPFRLIVSGHQAPDAKVDSSPMYLWSDEELKDLIRSWKRIPEEALGNPEFLSMALKILRADFSLSETYEYRQEEALPLAITALGGEEDALVTEQQLLQWQNHTQKDFSHVIFPGDHFFIYSEQKDLLSKLEMILMDDLDHFPKSHIVGKQSPYPQLCLHELFSEQAQRTPDRTAVVDGERSLQFSELDNKTDILAQYLQSKGVTVDTFVGIYLPTSLEYTIAYIAILKAGGAYLPLEIAYPPQLLADVLELTQPKVILTVANLVPYLPMDILPRTIQMEPGWEYLITQQKLSPLKKSTQSLDSLAYCVMTSGTTGKPKGICCPHRGAVVSYHWRHVYYPYEEGEREAANIFFVWEMLRPLLKGYPCYVISHDVIYDPPRLLDFLQRYQITRILFTPSLYKQVLDTIATSNHSLENLKIVYLCGEVVTKTLIQESHLRLPAVKLINLYSISECHDIATVDLHGNYNFTSEYAPCGFPMDNMEIYVLDENQGIVPMGATGEIYIGGPTLARGYLNQLELTQQRFVVNPHSKETSMLFRTGDIGRILWDGNLEVQGRINFMIKLRGYTIVLEAVAAAIEDHPQISSSVVLTENNENTKQPECLVAYIVADDPEMNGNEQLLLSLRQHLKNKLPHYAIPAHFICIDEIPLSATTGKLDRNKLPKFTRDNPSSSQFVAPDTKTEKAIASVWEKILKIERVQKIDNFFDLGGHSLLAAQVCSEISQKLAIPVAVVDIFHKPELQELAKSLAEKSRKTDFVVVEPAVPVKNSNEIAIIGVSCRFPGANNIEQFWRNLKSGTESIHPFSDMELFENGIAPEVYKHPDYIKYGAIMKNVFGFDRYFWDLSEQEILTMDPQHRIFLECCWEALEVAGYSIPTNNNIGVFASCFLPLYLLYYLEKDRLFAVDDPVCSHLTEIGNDKDYLASRVSYLLNLQGPSISVQTSCSSSLVTVATACQSLLTAQCDMALAGASSIIFPQGGYQYLEGHLQSRDGHCRAFDANASGTVLGDGAGVVLLKRLSDAQRDNDNIWGIIKGFAVNNDGKNKANFSAPSVEGQKKVIQNAYQMAGIDVSSISYIEGHGTGTYVGDAIELRALNQVFTHREHRCFLGSVKTNVGHSNIAAGMAGLLKTVLALKHKEIPATLHFQSPNSELVNSVFVVNQTLQPWLQSDETPRRAGVSCFGIGGTNCHMVLEEADSLEISSCKIEKQKQEQYHLLLSAKSERALQLSLTNLKEYLCTESVDLGAVEYTLKTKRQNFNYRTVISCFDVNSATEAAQSSSIYCLHKNRHKVVFAFPGQGAQYPEMITHLYHKYSRLRHHFDHCLALLDPQIRVNIQGLIENNVDIWHSATVSQAALFCLEYSLAKTFIEMEIYPDLLVGHSLGEYVAACISGVISLEDALFLVVVRAHAMELVSGAMLAAQLSQDQAKKIMESHVVDLAAINGEHDVVFSGAHDAIDALEKTLQSMGITCKRLDVLGAFHSRLLETAAQSFYEKIKHITLNSPQIPIVSNVSGEWFPNTQMDVRYWYEHMLAPVRFVDNVKHILQQQPDIILEVGPGKTLQSIFNKSAKGVVLASCMRHPEQKITESKAFAESLALLWKNGVNINWKPFYQDNRYGTLPLPTHPFLHQMYRYQKQAHSHVVRETKKYTDIDDWFYFPSWKRQFAINKLPKQNFDDRHWLVFLNRDETGDKIAQILMQAGYQATLIYSDDKEMLLPTLSQEKISVLYLRGLRAISHDDPSDYYDFLAVAKHLGLKYQHQWITIHIITTATMQVYQETIIASKSMLLGPCMVVPQEFPNIQCRFLDITLPLEPIFCNYLITYLQNEKLSHYLALREGYLWSQHYEQCDLKQTNREKRSVKDQVIVILGWGRIGNVLAQNLLQEGAKLVLVGKTKIQRDDERLKELLSIGKESDLLLIESDIADYEQVKKIFSHTQEKFGKVDGIFHTAGLADLKYIPDISDEVSQREFSAKISGVLHLEKVITESICKPRFVCIFSSLASILGGLGMCAYAAANRFLDTFCQAKMQEEVIWQCINWDDWNFSYTKEQIVAYEKTQAQYSMSPEEGWKALVKIMDYGVPAQLLVSTRSLETRIKEWIEKETQQERRTTQNNPTKDNIPPHKVESMLLQIYQKVLGNSFITGRDNFFDVGGDSLLASQILLNIRKWTMMDIPLGYIFDYPTVEELAQALIRREQENFIT